jgi:hypothetical protein
MNGLSAHRHPQIGWQLRLNRNESRIVTHGRGDDPVIPDRRLEDFTECFRKANALFALGYH